jgi:hypothetical protein
LTASQLRERGAVVGVLEGLRGRGSALHLE